MTAPPETLAPPIEVHDGKSPAEARESRALAVLNARGKDLADLTDAEFEAGLARLETVQHRMQRLLETALVEGAHYGNPKASNGKLAFKKPILYQAGAQELRRLMRLNLSRTKDDQVTSTSEYVEAIVTLGIYDQGGRFIVERRGTCNSKEKRFKKYDGQGWIYGDAREVLHDVIAMAEKRAAGLCTLEASGATAFLANGEEMDAALTDDTPITPWTAEEKKIVYEAAAKKSVGRQAFAELVHKTLGRAQVGTGDDVQLMLAAVKAYEAPKTQKGDAAEDDQK